MMYGVYYQMVGKEITGVEIDGKHYSESDIKSALSVPVPTLPCAVCGQASSDRTALYAPLPEIEGGDKGALDDLQTLGTSKQWTRLIQSLEQFRNRDTNEDVEVWADVIESAVEGFRTEANRVLAAPSASIDGETE